MTPHSAAAVRPEATIGRLCLQFFCFGAFSGFCYIVSQRLFEHNFIIAQALLWVALMAGLPLGAALGVRKSYVSDGQVALALLAGLLWMLAGNMLVASLATAWKWPPPLIAPHLLIFTVESVIGVVIFIPLWIACGLLELRLYQTLSARRALPQCVAYLSCIAGLLAANLLFFVLLPVPSPRWAGLLALAVAVPLGRLSNWRPPRPGWSVGLVLVGLLFMLDQRYLGPQLEFLLPRPSGQRVAHDAWTRYGRFTVLEDREKWIGFYGTIRHWWVARRLMPERAALLYQPGALPLSEVSTATDGLVCLLAPSGATLVVLGAGGGAQVTQALWRDPRVVYAVDIMPPVFPTMVSLGMSSLTDPRVRWAVEDGRRFMQQASERFDLVYLSSTESLAKAVRNLFEPADHLYTVEAIRLYRDRLTPGGFVVIKKFIGFSNDGLLAANYRRTLQAAGFLVRVLRVADQLFLFVGARDADGLARASRLLPAGGTVQEVVSDAETGRVLQDDRPFTASGVYSPSELFSVGIAALVLLAGAGWCMWQFVRVPHAAAAIVCGINYTILLLVLQLMLLFSLQNPLNAAMIGTIMFLSLVGLGAALSRHLPVLWLVAVAGGFVALTARAAGVLVALGVLSALSGSFFPALLNRFRTNTVSLLVLDGFGAVAASVLYLVIPAVWGLRVLLAVVIGVFALTQWLVCRVMAELPSSAVRLPDLLRPLRARTADDPSRRMAESRVPHLPIRAH